MFNGFVASQPVFKKLLLNGLMVLVRPVHDTPKVTTQLTYHVGSKDEVSGNRGLAHLVEHMLFKGTKKLLSEKDWPAVAQKMSAYTNAFTDYDQTRYIFECPSQYWKETFAIYADTMRNCRFEEQMLNSELKAVIQELKMGKDNYRRALIVSMISSIFVDHPYHYPVIGFKQDLWNLKRDDLFAFYQKHYVPNNAVLTVVGDVDPEEVFAEAEKTLGQIPKDPTYQRQEFYHSKGVPAQSITIYQDVKQPYGIFAFIVPGAKEKEGVLDTYIFSILLGKGKNSRLAKKLIDECDLVTEISTFVWSFEDASFFGIYYSAKNEKKGEEIRSLIQAEIQDIVKNGIPEKELSQALKRFKVSLLSSFERNSNQAEMIAEAFLFAGDENMPFKALNYPIDGLEKRLQNLVKKYFSPTVMHSGKVLSLPEEEKERWKELQELSDTEDARILEGRIRTLSVEPTVYANSVEMKDPKVFHFHKPEQCTLSNGIQVFFHNNKNIPKIELVFSLYADSYFDSEKKPGLYWFMNEMLLRGTKNYPGRSFLKEVQDYAMEISINQGAVSLSMLKEDLLKGLELLREILTEAAFDEKEVEKVREELLMRLKRAWDDPSWYVSQLVKERIYQGHPYGKNSWGTEETLKAITKKDLETFYKGHISAYKAQLALVGDLGGYNVKELLEKELGEIESKELPEQLFPALSPVSAEVITHTAQRDQVVLVFAGLSVPCTHADYDKLLLFDELFDGYGLSNSYLFRLRDRTGIFYMMSGSLTNGATEQPGMVYIYAMVSLDRLEEAKKALQELFVTVLDQITQEELETAKRTVLNDVINWFSYNKSRANTFLYLDRYKKPDNYCETRPEVINAITLDQVKEAVKKVLVPEKMITLQVGCLK